MFSFASTLNHIPTPLEAVLELHVSVNRPAIAAEGLDAQEAKAYFVTATGEHGIDAFVYLHMTTSHRALVYRWRGAVTKSDYPEVREAAIQFTESMGFMMEDMQFRRLQPGEKQRLADEYGLFRPLAAPQPPENSTQAPPGEEEVVSLDSTVQGMPEEAILDLSLDAPSTQYTYEQAPRRAASQPGESPLEDKNFKVFLRLLTSA